MCASCRSLSSPFLPLLFLEVAGCLSFVLESEGVGAVCVGVCGSFVSSRAMESRNYNGGRVTSSIVLGEELSAVSTTKCCTFKR